MQTYRVETTVPSDGKLTIAALPFQAGEKVEVIVRRREQNERRDLYPLRGKPFRYIAPVEGVAQNDWEVLQ